jgi:hypothetical protein
MSKGNMAVQRKAELILTESQAKHLDRVILHHEGCKKTVADLATHRYLMGAELLALKDDCKHGQFERIKTEILEAKGISRAMLGRAIQFAAGVQTKYLTVRYLKPDHFLKDGNLDERAKEKVVEFFHDETDGKSMTEFCRDLGIIRAKEAPKHHPRKLVSPEDKLSANKEHARGVMSAMLAPIATFMLDPGATLVELTKAERQQLLDAFVSASNEVRKFQKGK